MTSGLAILLTQQGAIAPTAAIAAVVGAKAGTTLTSLLASAAMSRSAKRAARANLLFNATGVVAVAPVLDRFAAAMLTLSADPAIAVAWAHLIFSVGVSIPFLIGLRPFERLVLRLWPERAGEAEPAGEPAR